MSNQIPFSMNYYALKTFGRQQYSNAWAALSELVANGFDAGASNVYLYIDMRDKTNSTIEIIDNGSGMDENDLQSKYAKIGRNRRLENPDDNAAGRKGIGKLAALYLSDEYQIVSKKNGQITAWSVNIANKNDIDIPSLEAVSQENIQTICTEVWNPETLSHGTMLRLLNVDLNRIGDRAIDALRQRLSNYFLFDSLDSILHLCIIREENDPIHFEKIQKQIAFDNMSHIYYSDANLIDTTKPEFEVGVKTKESTQRLSVSRIEQALPSDVAGTQQGNRISISGIGTFYGITKRYALKGWIGVHASIEKDLATKNDDRFVRNNFYNPNQIRIYVRNKLANEDILKRLGLVGTYANYIEGEISFDILDDNDFEDIATTNRQDFSIIDDRVNLLLEILRGLCRQLLQRRQELADKIDAEKKRIDADTQSRDKTKFAKETEQELLSVGIEPSVVNEVAPIIANKLKGSFELKTSYKLFISHASKDRIFTDFVVHYLKSRGFVWDVNVENTEIFYSSDGTDITNGRPLPEIIKTMILNSNTDILFLTSKQFLDSQYCLFEGGAAWATRAILDYGIIALDYDSIPEFLTNNKSEFTFDAQNKASFELNQQNYNNLVIMLNRFIKHLNNNHTDNPISEIPNAIFDDEVQMNAQNKTLKDYMDNDVYVYWDTYVLRKLDTYLATLTKDENAKS